MGVAASRIAGIGTVVNTQHGPGSLTRDPRLEAIFRATLPFTSKVVVVSEETRRLLISQRGLPEQKSCTILNGIPLERFQRHRARPGARPLAPIFGTVGRLAEPKDHLTLVDAFALVHKTLPNARLRIAGDGPLRSALLARINSLALGTSIHLVGEILDVPEFLSALDVFVLSSVTEALPVAILEAMASGLPIVSTDVGGVSEVAPADRVALFCRPRDSTGLATNMLHIANPKIIRAMGAAAYSQADRTGGIERMRDEYWTLYHRLGA